MVVTYTDTADLRRTCIPPRGPASPAGRTIPVGCGTTVPSSPSTSPCTYPPGPLIHLHPVICLVLADRNLPPHCSQRYGGVPSAVAAMAPGTKLPPCDAEPINISFREPYLPCYGARLARGCTYSQTPPGPSCFRDLPGSMPLAKAPLREGHLYTRFARKVPPDHGRSRPSPCFQRLPVSACLTVLTIVQYLGSRPYKAPHSRSISLGTWPVDCPPSPGLPLTTSPLSL